MRGFMQKVFPRRRLKGCIEGKTCGKPRIVYKVRMFSMNGVGVECRNFLITLDRSRYRVLIRALSGESHECAQGSA